MSTLYLMVRDDIPRLIGVFIVINISLGSGLYFALVGYYNHSNVNIANDNITRYNYTCHSVNISLSIIII